MASNYYFVEFSVGNALVRSKPNSGGNEIRLEFMNNIMCVLHTGQ